MIVIIFMLQTTNRSLILGVLENPTRPGDKNIIYMFILNATSLIETLTKKELFLSYIFFF